MRKYGNMSGWKAVRTLNRDARINAGQSPYGYKSRYANQGASRKKEPGVVVGFFQIWGEHPFIGILFLMILGPIFLVIWIWCKLEDLSESLVPKKSWEKEMKEIEKKNEEKLKLREKNPMIEMFEGQCAAKTKKGFRCQNYATKEGLCTQHYNNLHKN